MAWLVLRRFDPWARCVGDLPADPGCGCPMRISGAGAHSLPGTPVISFSRCSTSPSVPEASAAGAGQIGPVGFSRMDRCMSMNRNTFRFATGRRCRYQVPPPPGRNVLRKKDGTLAGVKQFQSSVFESTISKGTDRKTSEFVPNLIHRPDRLIQCWFV